MKKICIIPARGGSKRIERKNIRPFFGKPIIAYSIEAAIQSELFDEVMVSTDDDEIAQTARHCGAAVPFMRSAKAADDLATTFDVIHEVIAQYSELGQTFDFTCCLYATAPFVTAEKLRLAWQKMRDENAEAVFPVAEYSYPIQRSLHFENGYLRMNWPENLKKRSQDLEKNYHDAGQFYMYKTNAYLEKKGVYLMDSTAIICTPVEVQDIDNEIDWKLAELKFKLLENSQ